MITLTREEAQQVLDALEDVTDGAEEPHKTKEAIGTLRARLAQSEPEPVADKYLMEIECTKCGAKQDGILTVNAPPQREWQGLTDEEAKEVWKQLNYDLNHGKFAADDTERHVIVEFYRAIEAKLKEKNT
jgi:hypothetical protein